MIKKFNRKAAVQFHDGVPHFKPSPDVVLTVNRCMYIMRWFQHCVDKTMQFSKVESHDTTLQYPMDFQSLMESVHRGISFEYFLELIRLMFANFILVRKDRESNDLACRCRVFVEFKIITTQSNPIDEDSESIYEMYGHVVSQMKNKLSKHSLKRCYKGLEYDMNDIFQLLCDRVYVHRLDMVQDGEKKKDSNDLAFFLALHVLNSHCV